MRCKKLSSNNIALKSHVLPLFPFIYVYCAKDVTGSISRIQRPSYFIWDSDCPVYQKPLILKFEWVGTHVG